MTDALDLSLPPDTGPNQPVCLTVLLPAAAEDALVDWLLAHDEWGVEFSVHQVAARGPLVQLADGEERVRGYAQRVEVKLILDRRRLPPLLTQLRTLMRGVAGGYWLMPVERFEPFDPLPGTGAKGVQP